jgi:hypothetical protein
MLCKLTKESHGLKRAVRASYSMFTNESTFTWLYNRLVGQANPGALVRQIRPHPRGRIVSELGYDCSRVLIRRFVAYEVRVISTKKEAFEALRISKNVTWNPLTFRAKEIGESVDGASKPLVY